MQTPDYSKYSLHELIETLKNIDADSYPERVQLIRQQIEIKRAKVPEDPTLEPEQNFWKRRFKAFLFDCSFAFGPFVLFDNFLSYPIDNVWLIIISMLWFSGYFTYFEVLKKQSTPGKQRYNLKIARINQTDRQALSRVFIITIMFFSNDVALLIQLLSVPYLFVFVVSFLGSALLYNIYLAIKAPTGIMLQDAISSSAVVDNDENSGISTVSLYKAWLLPTLFVVLTTAYLYLIPSATEAQDPVGSYIENSVAEKLKTRTRIGITEKEIWRTGQEGSIKALEIIVWVPFMGWNDDNLNRVTEVILDEITITPDFYDEGSLTLETGWGFKLSNTYELDMPETGDVEITD